jgi:extracellular factor (EF) 3-hydroxypalmitic acid methyl ester biosynthesis protein
MNTARDLHSRAALVAALEALEDLGTKLQALQHDALAAGERAAFAGLRQRWVRLSEALAALSENERAFVRAEFRSHLNPTFHRAELPAYAAARPRGYPGDFGAMEIIFTGCSLLASATGPAETDLDALINRFVLGLENCRANVSRAHLLASLLARLPEGSRIASLGAGSGIEVDLALRAGGLRGAEIHLFDQDEGAHAAAREKLARHGVVPHCHVGKVVRAALRADEASFDFLYSSGMFDYFSTDAARRLVARFWQKVAPGGAFLITNAHPDNPTRLAMEWISDWELVYKTRDEMLSLAEGLPAVAQRELTLDPYGVYQYLAIHRQPQAVLSTCSVQERDDGARGAPAAVIRFP